MLHLNSSQLHEELIIVTEHFTKSTPHSEHSTFTCLCTTEILLSYKVYCHDSHHVIFCTQHSYCLSGKESFIPVSWYQNYEKDTWLIYSWFFLQTACAKRLLHHQLILHENRKKVHLFLVTYHDFTLCGNLCNMPSAWNPPTQIHTHSLTKN
jgi:hypothetical protein